MFHRIMCILFNILFFFWLVTINSKVREVLLFFFKYSYIGKNVAISMIRVYCVHSYMYYDQVTLNAL